MNIEWLSCLGIFMTNVSSFFCLITPNDTKVAKSQFYMCYCQALACGKRFNTNTQNIQIKHVWIVAFLWPNHFHLKSVNFCHLTCHFNILWHILFQASSLILSIRYYLMSGGYDEFVQSFWFCVSQLIEHIKINYFIGEKWSRKRDRKDKNCDNFILMDQITQHFVSCHL